MKRKREIEMAKTALKMEEEELDIETDIAVADAKSKVYDHLVKIMINLWFRRNKISCFRIQFNVFSVL
jgi:hypothetical protein